MDDFLLDLPALKPRRGTYVRETAELRRIRDLPRRDWERDPRVERLCDVLTERLRTGATIPAKLLTKNGGPVPDRLLPAQAWGLMECKVKNGAIGPLITGGGKTLWTLLQPTVSEAKVSVLNLPKRMVRKTYRTAEANAPYWRLPDVLVDANGKRKVLRSTVERTIHVIQYEILPHRPDLLLNIEPELYMGDEAHALKHTKSARTKIIRRLRRLRPKMVMLFLSGSFMGRSLREFAHLSKWALGLSAPVPQDWTELEEWDLAIAEGVDEFSRMEPGALLQLGDAGGETPLETARKRFAQRLVSTPGVISTDNDLPPNGLIVRERDEKPTPAMKHWISELRRNNELPNGDPCEDALSLYAKERQAGRGFWYQYVTPPPIEWRHAKRAFCRAMVRITSGSSKLVSAMHVVNALDQGKLDDPEAKAALADWRAIRDTFEPVTEAKWFDDSTLNMAAKWLAEEEGLCWVSYIEFGRRLSEMTKIPYFQEQACTKEGLYIADHSGPAIVSVHSCHEGLDLQHGWSKNLFSDMVTGQRLEQIISRTHRRGQKADDVLCDVILRVEADKNAWHKAKMDAKCVTDGMSQKQRLAIATYIDVKDDQ